MTLRYLNFVATIILLFLTVYILFLGKGLFLPLIIALVFWYIIVRLTHFYHNLSIKGWHAPYPLALTVAVISAAIVIYIFFLLLTHSIANMVSSAPLYQKKIQQVLDFINQFLVGKLDLHQLMSKIDIANIVSKLALIVSLVASNFALILIYTLFLALEHRTFSHKLKNMCSSNAQYKKINAIFQQITHDVNSYLKIKTAVNLIAGILSYIVLLAFGVKNAEFWGILFFLVHYVPYIGPIVGVVLTLLAVSVQINSLAIFLVLSALLIIIQFGIGNFLEPRWMGTRLNLSPIVILLSLAFWGIIWGVIGMILCVPIMVILNIILSKFEKTRPIAVLLSADGRIS